MCELQLEDTIVTGVCTDAERGYTAMQVLSEQWPVILIHENLKVFFLLTPDWLRLREYKNHE